MYWVKILGPNREHNGSPAIRECDEDEARRAEQEQADFTEFLLEILKQENEVRLQKRIERWLSEFQLPLHKNLESFDLKRLPKKVMHQVRVLRDGSFLGRKVNVLAFGNPGILWHQKMTLGDSVLAISESWQIVKIIEIYISQY